MLRGSNLSGDVGMRLNDADLVFLDSRLADGFVRSTAHRNDLVFTCWGTIGQIGFIDESSKYESYVVSNKQMKMTPDRHKVHPLFLYYLLSQPRMVDLVASQAIGSSVPGFNLGQLKTLQVTIPDLSTQWGIAEVLGAVDDKIATNAKTMRVARNLAESMFARAVGHDGDEVVLGDVTSLLTRGVTPRYAESADAAVILNQKCIRDRRVSLGPARHTERGSVKQAKWLLQNDVLVNSTGQGTLGRVARWTMHSEATADSHVSILRFDASCVEPVCAGYAVLGLEDLIEQMGEGSTGQTELSRTELGKVTLRVPGRDQQADMGRRLSGLSDIADGLYAESESLAQTRDALLPQLMSGRIRVKDAAQLVGDVV